MSVESIVKRMAELNSANEVISIVLDDLALMKMPILAKKYQQMYDANLAEFKDISKQSDRLLAA